MSINVTPIPRLVELAVPALSLGTANAAGDATTAIASNSTILTYDATVPDAITFGQSGATGSSATAARRDHAHAMASETASLIGCRVYDDANQSIATHTSVALAFEHENFDTDTMHDTSTNNTRITAKTAGTYIIYGNLAWNDGTTHQRQVTIRLNGSTIIGQINSAPAINGRTEQDILCIWQMDEDDYVELVCYQNTGSALNVMAAAGLSEIFGALKIASY